MYCKSNSAKFKLVACVLATFALNTAPKFANATGISEYEGTQCVGVALDLGLDATVCVDTDLPDCQIPDWFPTDAQSWAGMLTTVNSYALSSSVRYNELVYDVAEPVYANYPHWEHDWYSKVDVSYGPALPSWGHMWNEYSGSTLVKSVSCDVHGTVSFP